MNISSCILNGCNDAPVSEHEDKRSSHRAGRAGISPVWKAESGVSFLHLLFELLHTVQKGHHGVVKLIVPEEPQAT